MKYCKVSCVFWCSLLTMSTCILQGQGIGGVSISAGEGLSATTTAEGVYVLNNVTAGGYTIQVGSIQKTKKGIIIQSCNYCIQLDQDTKQFSLHMWLLSQQ